MSSDFTTVVAYYDNLPEIPALIRRLVTAGWSPRNENGEIAYEVDLRRQQAADIDEFLKGISTTDSVWVSLYNGESEMTLTTEIDFGSQPGIQLLFPTWTLERDGTPTTDPGETIEKIVEAVRIIVEQKSPRYGFGDVDVSVEPDRIPSLEQLENGELPYVFWLLLLPLADTENGFSWEGLSELPFWRVERLSETLALAVMVDNPYQPSEDRVQKQRQLEQYLAEGQ